ncbi:MAG: very short patch repair endonuclease [Candidatus Cloacimonetes bacterium]|nr:very short patch repair endonuclease [Candidatus Cloacimonadota bacterium]
MTDVFDQKKRQWIMRRVKSKNTAFELKIRSKLHGMGYRYRIHCKDLPGSPDIVFVAKKKVILLHGCFWHGHNCKRGARVPKTNTQYWKKKIKANVVRDKDNLRKLDEMGWKALAIWECQMNDFDGVIKRIHEFLGQPRCK